MASRAWHRCLCTGCEPAGRVDSERSGPSGMIPAMLRRYRWLLIGVAVLVAAPIVGTFLYFNVLRDDPPERLSLDDVTTTTGRTGSTVDDAAAEGIEGAWTVGDQSVVGYRVQRAALRPERRGRRPLRGRHGGAHHRGHDGHRGVLRGRHDHLRERRVPPRRPVRGSDHGGGPVPHGDLRADRTDRARRRTRRRGGRSTSRPPVTSPSTA